MDPLFMLVHSPLVGPFTWSLVSEELRARSIDVVVPVLADTEGSPIPYWKQHAESVALALQAVPADRSLTLVGHSGAGPILPAIAQHSRRHIGAYIFANAGLPGRGENRLEMLRAEAPELADQLLQLFASGGRFPSWSDDELREVIPRDDLRQTMLEELHPRGLDFFAEPIPVFEAWPDAVCMYLLFSAPYRSTARQAEQAGWPYRAFEAGHFHMLVEPVAVAAALVDLAQSALD